MTSKTATLRQRPFNSLEREADKRSRTRFIMNNTKEPFNRKFSAGFLALLLALVSVTLVAPTASAVGANQNDLGSNMDLPDNSTSINSSQAVMNMNGYAPMASGALYGELDVGDEW